VSVRLCRGGGQGDLGQSPRSGGFFFQKIDMAESDNILTKLQDLLLYLSPEA